MPLAWYDLLLQLAEAPERRLRMADLADRVLLSRSGLTRLVDRLQAEGLVAREPYPGDARGTYTVLTAEGLDRMRAAAPVHLAGVEEYWLSKLDDDSLRELQRLLDRLESGACLDDRASERVRRAAAASVIRDSLGVGIAVGSYGVAFGLASVAAGLSVVQTVLLSALAFTGGTQFAVVGVVGGGGTVGAALGSGLLLGARNTLYAMRLAPLLHVRGPRRLVAALGTIDESTAMAVGQAEPPLSRLAFWWTFAGVYTFWNLSTLIGAVGRQRVGRPDEVRPGRGDPGGVPRAAGPRLRSGWIERRVAITAAVIAAVLIPVTPPGVPVLAAAAALLLSGTIRRRPA